jgi:hypothetical protein
MTFHMPMLPVVLNILLIQFIAAFAGIEEFLKDCKRVSSTYAENRQ